MRVFAAVAVLLILMSGCASKSDNSSSGNATSSGASSSGPATVSGAPNLGNKTLNGTALPSLKISGAALAVRVMVAGGADVFRVRLVANATFTVRPATGSGNNAARGAALFPAGQGPRLQPVCNGLEGNRVWDSRVNGTSAAASTLSGTAGSWDLWLWLASGDNQVVAFNGGNTNSPSQNVSSSKTGWVNRASQASMVVTAGATSVSFSVDLNVTKGGLFWGHITTPNSPSNDGTLTTEVTQSSACASASATRPSPAQNISGLYLGTALATGKATWTGTYTQTAPMFPFGSGSASGVVLTQA